MLTRHGIARTLAPGSRVIGATALIHADTARHGYVWHVEFDGEIIVHASRDPVCDLARALVARGIAGSVTVLDGKTKKPRLIVADIEKLAGLRTEEGSYGPRFVKRRESRTHQTQDASPR